MMKTKIDLLLTICDLYYNQKLTQAQIAKKMDISRPTVSRIIEEAKEQGIVTITISAPLVINNLLSNQVKKKYFLKNVLVIKNTGNYDFDLENLGKVTANLIENIVNEGSVLGISWGNAIQSFVTQLEETIWKNVKIVQINGSLGSEVSSMDGSELVIRLGAKTQSNYELLTAPAFVDSEQLQLQLLEQTQIKRVIDQGDNYDITVSGIGNLIPEKNTLYNAKILAKKDLQTLDQEGVVGHIAGRMYDIHGNEVRIKNKWPISPKIETFIKVPTSIGAAIGKDRAKAVIGAINGQYINTLICDEALANSLLTLKKLDIF